MPDILIRGMEMPSKGYKTVILHSNGSVYEPTSNELILNKIADATELPPQTIETNLFDQEETYPNCTVQILRNSVTGEVSVGWWENEEETNGD